MANCIFLQSKNRSNKVGSLRENGIQLPPHKLLFSQRFPNECNDGIEAHKDDRQYASFDYIFHFIILDVKKETV
jgi:hypothetical protein